MINLYKLLIIFYTVNSHKKLDINSNDHASQQQLMSLNNFDNNENENSLKLFESISSQQQELENPYQIEQINNQNTLLCPINRHFLDFFVMSNDLEHRQFCLFNSFDYPVFLRYKTNTKTAIEKLKQTCEIANNNMGYI